MGMELRRNRQTFPRILLIVSVRRGLGTPFHYSLSKRGAAFKMPRLSQHSVRCRLNGLPTGPSCSPIPRLAPLRLSNCANSTSRHSRYSSRPFGLRSGPDLSIPNFDPWDGGIDAESPYLLEATGAKQYALSSSRAITQTTRRKSSLS